MSNVGRTTGRITKWRIIRNLTFAVNSAETQPTEVCFAQMFDQMKTDREAAERHVCWTNIKVLVVGHRGWIGSQILALLKEAHRSYPTFSRLRPLAVVVPRGDVRGDNLGELEKLFDQTRPTHVFSCIGRTHGTTTSGTKFLTIDFLEQKGELKGNIRDNLFAPLLISALCLKRAIHLTYIGTGCIYEYDRAHPREAENTAPRDLRGFSETDEPNFFGSSYSVVKGFTDRIMHDIYNDSTLNLRVRMPITARPHPRNFVTKLTTYDKICSIENSMSVLPELLPLAIDMALRRITGTFNLTNPGVISHNSVLGLYREIVDPKFCWKNFSKTEQDAILAADRSNNCLSTFKLTSLYPSVRNVTDAVRAALESWKTGRPPEPIFVEPDFLF